MSDREESPTCYRDCDIVVVTERMDDGRWAVIAKVRHETAASVQVTPLPDPGRYFSTEDQARRYRYEQARAWIERQAPAA